MQIKIAGKFYAFFNDVVVNTPIDSVASTFAFTAVFDPANPEHRFLFKPLSYHKVEFLHDDGEVFSTGTLVTVSFNSDKRPNLVKCSGYSLGGVLEDVQIPPDMYPLESINRTLKEITERLLKRFGLKLVVYSSAARECDELITKSVADPGESIKDYISKIAAQKNVVFSHDVHGNLIFFRPDAKARSKGLFNASNALDFGAEYNGQALHSQITIVRQPSASGSDEDGERVRTYETIHNPLVKPFRPYVAVQTSGKEADTNRGAKNSFAAELKAIRVGFSVCSNQSGQLPRLSIGDMVEVQNDEVYLFKNTRMMVENTVVSEDSKSKTLAVTCVLPETFTGEQPKQLFE